MAKLSFLSKQFRQILSLYRRTLSSKIIGSRERLICSTSAFLIEPDQLAKIFTDRAKMLFLHAALDISFCRFRHRNIYYFSHKFIPTKLSYHGGRVLHFVTVIAILLWP